MPIRDYYQPAYMGVSPQLSDVLLKNGMRAQVILGDNNKMQLVVQGHDSPTLTYPVTEAQVRTLSRQGGATGSDLKAAYKLFTSIVGKDFYMPVDLTHAKNVNNRVSMGLHGYRVGIGEPGANPALYRPRLVWAPNQQGGYHLRRMAGTVFYGGGQFVPDRPGSRVKPGELASGGYGFYWKGTANGRDVISGQSSGNVPALNPDSQQHLLEQLSQIKIQPIREIPKPKKYSDEISSDVYFTSDKFLEVLTSHGILVDKDTKTMTLRSEAVNFDISYDLTDEEVATLTDNSIENHPVQERIDLINRLYGKDYKPQLTFADLDSERPLNLEMGDHVSSLLISQSPAAQLQYTTSSFNTTNSMSTPYSNRTNNELDAANQVAPAQQTTESNQQTVVPGNQFTPPVHAAYVQSTNEYPQVQSPYPVSSPQPGEPQLVSEQIGRQADGTTQIYVPESHEVDAQEYYRVQSAVLHADPKQVAQVNGEDINFLNPEKGWYREGSHGRAVTVDQIIVYPIEENDKNEKYMMTAVIDGEMVSHKISQKDYDKFLALDDFHRMKLFSKIFPEVDLKDNYQVGLGTKIVAGIAAGLTVASDVMLPGMPYGGPGRGAGSVYFKPGVDTPSDIAHRAFEAGMNTQRMDRDLHQGW